MDVTRCMDLFSKDGQDFLKNGVTCNKAVSLLRPRCDPIGPIVNNPVSISKDLKESSSSTHHVGNATPPPSLMSSPVCFGRALCACVLHLKN